MEMLELVSVGDEEVPRHAIAQSEIGAVGVGLEDKRGLVVIAVGSLDDHLEDVFG